MTGLKYMREETADEYGIKVLQDKILEIAVYIDAVCTKHNIQYFLMGGSALGALRHKGFIPWDDDLDFFMRPAEYELFRDAFNKYGNKEKYYLQELCEDDGKIVSAKLRLNGTTYIEEATKNWKIHQGIFVDIFILHNAPGKEIARIFQCLCAKAVLVKGQEKKGARYSGVKGIALTLSSLLPFSLARNLSLWQLYRYDTAQSELVCHYTGKAFYKKGLYRADFFDHAERIQFETVQLNVPCNTHQYLTERFGDYMVLPPRESIKTAQHAAIWDTEKDFSVYVNKERDFSDERYLV